MVHHYDRCVGLKVRHPNDEYTGYYIQTENWNGFPHLESQDGKHFYWLDDDGYGFWCFDNREQDGTLDQADGGYMMCEGEWYDCPNNYDETGYAEYDYMQAGTVHF